MVRLLLLGFSLGRRVLLAVTGCKEYEEERGRAEEDETGGRYNEPELPRGEDEATAGADEGGA